MYKNDVRSIKLYFKQKTYKNYVKSIKLNFILDMCKAFYINLDICKTM